MSYAERVKRSALLVLVGTALMVFVAGVLAGLGQHTGFVIGAGGIVIAICTAIIAVAGRGSRR